MKKHLFGQFKAISVRLWECKIPFLLVLCISAVALATPPLGIIVNQIVAKGAALADIREKLRVVSNPDRDGEHTDIREELQIASNPDRDGESADLKEELQVASNPDRDGENEDWQLQVRTEGATDFYVQHLVVGPGGYSGWHTHPGLLIGTVVSGGIDFFDANCQKRSFTAGQVFTENTQVHAIINTGSVNADLSIAYLIKHNTARRIEADAPACAPSTGIP
jgi:quercetin dioxygenase-like cupin family protein